MFQDGMDTWQIRARQEIFDLYEECCASRALLVPIIQNIPMPNTEPDCKAHSNNLHVPCVVFLTKSTMHTFTLSQQQIIGG